MTLRHVQVLPANLVSYHSPTPALDAAEQHSLMMITRIMRSLPLALTALACLAPAVRAADEAKNDYGTVIGIGTRYCPLAALSSSSAHYPAHLQTWVLPTRPLGTIIPLRHPMRWPPTDLSPHAVYSEVDA